MKIRSLLIGLVAGMILVSVMGWLMMPGLMLKEYQSTFGFEETIEKIMQNAVAEGWVVSSVVPLNESVKKHGGGDLPPIRLVPRLKNSVRNFGNLSFFNGQGI